MTADQLAKEIAEELYRANRPYCMDIDATTRLIASKLSPLVKDAERFRFIEAYHVKGGSLHMDGTDVFVLGGSLGRARSLREAVDAKMKYHEWKESEATND